MPSSSKSILVVDDDPEFRLMLKELFNSRGLEVIEARSGAEADTKLHSINPIMAIVDYRLPEIDGMTWISNLRKTGRTFPLVFLSKVWCDPKTFNWLRNILRVSLILQKPIMPELFLQQVESLLPASLLQEIQNPPASAINLPTAEIPVGDEAQQSQQELLVHINDLRSQMDRQNKLAAVKANYAEGMAKLWAELSNSIGNAHNNNRDAYIINEAKLCSHTLAGTAGSVGFAKIGNAAAKIEELLNNLDPSDTLQEIIWAEIFRILADGEIAVREAKRVSDAVTHGGLEALSASNILLYGQKEEYQYIASNLSNTGTPVQIEVVEGQVSLLQQIRHNSFDAVIFDASLGDKERIFRLATEIRMLPGYQSLPFAFIDNSNSTLKASELIFAGCSVFTAKPLQKADIERTCKQLLSCPQIHKPRVLIVDDDEVLTKFISTVLSEESILTSVLNNPIEIRTAVADFKPDLVLLDVVMPGLSGYDICRMLRNDDQWRDLAIVFLTAKNDQQGRASAYQAGGNDFLSKPVLTQELITRINAQLDIKRKNVPRLNEQRSGIFSSQDFAVKVNKCLSQAKESEMPAVLCLLSVDDFANTMAVHSLHSAQQTTAHLETLINCHFRPNDLRGRLVEDTFMLAFAGEEKQTIVEAIEKLLADFSETEFSSTALGHFKTTFSASIAEYPHDGGTFKDLYSVAYQRLLNGRRQLTGAIAS